MSNIQVGVTPNVNRIEVKVPAPQKVEVLISRLGVRGPAGPGVPPGGDADQVLTKIDGTDFNTEWRDSSGGIDIIKGIDFTGVFDLSAIHQIYYNDYREAPAIAFSIAPAPVTGSFATVRIQGDLTGVIPSDWNFSGDALTPYEDQLNELTIVYVDELDIRITNRVVVAPDIDPPIISNFEVTAPNANRIYFESNEPILASTFGGFTLNSGKNIIGISINAGQTTGHYFTVDSDYIITDGNDAITYSGTGSDLRDPAGNILEAFGPDTVLNNVEVPGEVLVAELRSVDELTSVNQASGTVGIEPTVTSPGPDGDVLTLTNTAQGQCWGAIDLGQTYDKLYIQVYVCILQGSTQSGYTDCFEVGPGAYLNETAKLQLNHEPADDRYRIFGVPGFAWLRTYNKEGTWFKFGMEIDRVAQTVNYYRNGVLMQTDRSINNQDMQWVTMGGGRAAGYKAQFYGLTVNELGFQDAFSIPELDGTPATVFIDGELDPTIDTSSFSGKIKEPFDPDGGTAYIDGPLRYITDVSNIYFEQPTNNPDSAGQVSKILFKRGSYHYAETILNGHSLNLGTGSTSETKYYIVDAYGDGAPPEIRVSIPIEKTGWSLHDAPNNIYVKSLPAADYGNARGVWINGLGLTEQNALSEVSDWIGSMYLDNSANLLYVRLWDESDPANATGQISLATQIGLSLNPYCTTQYLHVVHGGLVASQYSRVQFCTGSHGGALSAQQDSVLYKNHLFNRWGGKQYYDSVSPPQNAPSTRGSASNTAAINTNSNALIYDNIIEDSYVGIQVNYNYTNLLIAFNTFKNCIVNTMQISGGTGANTDPANAIRFINNTVFTSPRHINNDPYFGAYANVGHGMVWQTGAGSSRHEFINNLILTHYNGAVPDQIFVGSANCVSSSTTPDNNGLMDYNLYYITPNSDVRATLFTTGQNNPNDLNEWISIRDAQGWTGVLGTGLPEQNSIARIGGTSPVVSFVALPTSGKFEQTNPDPANGAVNNGYTYDFSAWPEVEQNMGILATGAQRNIGSK